MRIARLAWLAMATVFLGGCHSAYIDATVSNNSGTPIRLLEVDYPSASFGTGELASGATFHYRFKVLGSGATKVSWTDPQQKDHTVQGPTLQEGQEGQLTINISPETASWHASLHP